MKIGRLHQAISYFAQFEEITVNHWPVLLHLLRLNLTITTGQFLDSAFEHSATSHKTSSLEGVGFSAPWTSGSPMRKNGIMYEVLFFSRLLAEQQCKRHAKYCANVLRSSKWYNTTRGTCEYNICIQPMRTIWYGWSLKVIDDQNESVTNVEQLYVVQDTNLDQTNHRRHDASIINPKTNRKAPAGYKLLSWSVSKKSRRSQYYSNRARCTFYKSATHSG